MAKDYNHHLPPSHHHQSYHTVNGSSSSATSNGYNNNNRHHRSTTSGSSNNDKHARTTAGLTNSGRSSSKGLPPLPGHRPDGNSNSNYSQQQLVGSYGLSYASSLSNGNRMSSSPSSSKSYIFVKLTEQALRAIEEYVQSRGTTSSTGTSSPSSSPENDIDKPSISFPSSKSSQGVIVIPSFPNGNCSTSSKTSLATTGEKRIFNFSLSPYDCDGSQGSLECLQQRRGNDSLVSLGRIEHKIKIQADSNFTFEATKAKMTAANNEAAKKATKVIPNNSRTGRTGKAGKVLTAAQRKSNAILSNNHNCNRLPVPNGINSSSQTSQQPQHRNPSNAMPRVLPSSAVRSPGMSRSSPMKISSPYSNSPQRPIPSSSASVSNTLNITNNSRSPCPPNRGATNMTSTRSSTPTITVTSSGVSTPKRSTEEPLLDQNRNVISHLKNSCNQHPSPTPSPASGVVPSPASSGVLSPSSVNEKIKERDRLREEFNRLHPVYRQHYSTLEIVTKKFCRLEERLKNSVEGSDEWNRVMNTIFKEYDELKKDSKFQETKKKVCDMHAN